MRPNKIKRSFRTLRPQGPAWARFLLSTLLFSIAFALAFVGLDWFANLSVNAFLPGPAARYDLVWIMGFGGLAGLAAAVAFEWSLHRGIRQAAERAEAGDPIGAARRLDEVTGHGLEHSAAAVQSYLDECLPASPHGELPEEVARLVNAGEQLRAVKRLRELTGLEVADAIRLVEAYLAGRASGAGQDQ